MEKAGHESVVGGIRSTMTNKVYKNGKGNRRDRQYGKNVRIS